MIDKTEKELMRLVKKKDNDAFNSLFSKYKDAIFNFSLKQTGNKALAQEILQETFTKLWFSADKFNPEKGSLKNWLYAISLNLCRNEMVKKRYQYHYDDIVNYSNQLSSNDQTDQLALKNEEKEKVAKALAKLKPNLREIVLLKHYQELKFREIAEVTAISENTLKSRFQKALSELKKIFQDMEKV